MTEWREHLASGKWREVLHSFPECEPTIEECKFMLSHVLPKLRKVTRGDGVETYTDEITYWEARTREEMALAALADFCKSQIEDFVRKTGKFLPFSTAVGKAVKVLADHGIGYQGLNDTFVYLDGGGGFKQLRQNLGRALVARRKRWLESDELADMEKALHELKRYPWRKCYRLSIFWVLGGFEKNTAIDHALHLLNAVEEYWLLFEEAADSGRNYTHVLRLSELAYEIGREHEALIKKRYEPDAVRGEKVVEGAGKSGASRAEALKAETDARLNEMRRLIAKGHTKKRAAELAFAGGLGVSARANRALWYRYQE